MASNTAPDNVDVDVPRKNKRFIPLENNPVVMTSLLHNLGLSSTLTWSDIYSLSDPDLLSFLPRPSYALLLVFPISENYENFRRKADENVEEYKGSGKEEEVLWFKQTIGNACGLYGLLHSVGSGEARGFVTKGSALDDILTKAVDLDPVKRSELLYESQALEDAHRTAAGQGDSNVPNAEDEVELHYVAFVKSSKGKLWEMDGRRKGPILLGELGEEEDCLSEKALDLGARAFLKREVESGKEEVRFSAVSLGPEFDD